MAAAAIRQRINAALTFGPAIALGALALITAAMAGFFGLRTFHLLTFPYPLDYGEGPLLAQIEVLLSGAPFWSLYADPEHAPYLVVNYPPVYHLAALIPAILLRLVTESDATAALLGGRLISLFAAIGCIAALYRLTASPIDTRSWRLLPLMLVFPALPIVREWSALVRVDMLGVCLGLWGLVVLQRGQPQRRLWGAALLLALCLLTKPSLIAAPAAALLWLLARQQRHALMLSGYMALIGGGVTVLFQIGSGGWFFFHVVTANANPWDLSLARGFWQDQWVILWPLVAAGTLAGIYGLIRLPERFILPAFYTLFGAIVAFGVGKYGAYTNYFLDFYAGLVWLIALASNITSTHRTQTATQHTVIPWQAALQTTVLILTVGALMRYYPLWSQTFLKPYGLIEGDNPPRLSFGAYGIQNDLEREAVILRTLARINAALVEDVRAAAEPIFTDVPGIAAQADRLSRVQIFEHRQIYDIGRWDQRPLLRDLANGRVPLIVLDFLGNWMTPEMVTIIRHRYAQEGSRGAYDLFRPVAPGSYIPADLTFAEGLRVSGYFLAPPQNGDSYAPGESILVMLEWQKSDPAPTAPLEVIVQLTDSTGTPIVESVRPLVYGALAPADWDGPTQHMQTLELPPELLPFRHQLAIALRAVGREPAKAQPLTEIAIGEAHGAHLGEPAYYVPDPFLRIVEQSGGIAQFGAPLMPAVPFFDDALYQCFTWNCLTMQNGRISRLPLGELVLLGDAALQPLDSAAQPGTELPSLSGSFREYWQTHGGETVLGPPITGELRRRDAVVQYTRYARLERPLNGGDVVLGRLGEEFLRQPAWVPYRWP
jgi:hypothetical protein